MSLDNRPGLNCRTPWWIAHNALHMGAIQHNYQKMRMHHFLDLRSVCQTRALSKQSAVNCDKLVIECLLEGGTRSHLVRRGRNYSKSEKWLMLGWYVQILNCLYQYLKIIFRVLNYICCHYSPVEYVAWTAHNYPGTKVKGVKYPWSKKGTKKCIKHLLVVYNVLILM